MTTNYISDLGAGPNGSDIVFNIGVIIAGIFYIPFYVYIGRYLQKKSDNINFIKKGMIAGIIAAIAHIFIGIFPLSSENQFSNNMHGLVALILFINAAIMAFIYGVSEHRNVNIPLVLTILSFCYAILDITVIISAIIDSVISVHIQAHTFLIEWLTLYISLVWAIAHIFYTLEHR
ncbi:MAG: DUF998 domain-containing protein [Promethearchaeota archaeon]